MWVWNKAFLIRNPKDQNNQIAVILMDTQGMFDGETNQMMTTCIFGLATLLSSYQIYNIDKRLQEDILQHLALFSEYTITLFSSFSNRYSRVVYTQDREEMENLKSKSFLAVQNNNETSPKKEEEEKKEEDPKQLNEASLQLLHSESLKGIKVVNVYPPPRALSSSLPSRRSSSSFVIGKTTRTRTTRPSASRSPRSTSPSSWTREPRWTSWYAEQLSLTP